MLDDRAFAIHCARVYLTEAARRRHSRANRNFYWTLLAWAANQRRKAAALAAGTQREMFASEVARG
jgi:hypothetical protein